jgi:ribosome-associated translation inhibitor RaiA
MQVSFESRDPDGANMRDIAERRVRFVMRRLSWLIPHARMHLSDVNGPRGGLDKRCRVELKTDTAGTLVVTATAGDWRSAIERALARAVKVLTRNMGRRRAHQHATLSWSEA